MPNIRGDIQLKPYDNFSASGVFRGKYWGGESKLGAANSYSQAPYGLQMDFGGNQPHENRQSFITAFQWKRVL